MSDERVHRVRLSLEGNYRFTASFPEVRVAPNITLDEGAPLGEGHGPNPAALLGAAVGHCLASSLLFCLRKARGDAGALDVEVEVRVARNDAGRFRIAGISVLLDPAIAEEDQARLDRCESLFEDFCIVTESVRQGVPVEVRLGDRVLSKPA
ncbi:MAG: OsmC family protein [Vicinamibacterales bacterium]